MVSQNVLLKRMAKLYLMTVMMYTFGGIGASRLNGPSFRTIKSGDSFEMTMVSDIEGCIDKCERWTSCKVVNYRKRGHICYLVHHIGGMAVDIRKDKTPGFVSWTKPWLNVSITTENDVCPQCHVTQSCEKNPTDGTCKISACGKPPKCGEISRNGNIYTVGSQLAYMCYDHDNDQTYPHFTECAADGTWTNMHNICGYTSYSLTDGSAIMLKVVNIMVNQTTAMRKCQTEGSSLITVFSVAKLDLLRGIMYGSQDSYWIDVHRFNETYWQTSDGREQPMDSSMLHEYHFSNNENENCARLRAEDNWRITDRECFMSFSYICELV